MNNDTFFLYRHDDFDVDLEEIMVAEAIWLSMQVTVMLVEFLQLTLVLKLGLVRTYLGVLKIAYGPFSFLPRIFRDLKGNQHNSAFQFLLALVPQCRAICRWPQPHIPFFLGIAEYKTKSNFRYEMIF